MTRLELMNINKKRYADCLAKIEKMPDDIEKSVAIHITLHWIKGNKWMGGLGSGKSADRAFEKAMNNRWSFEEVDAEFERQISAYIDEDCNGKEV